MTNKLKRGPKTTLINLKYSTWKIQTKSLWNGSLFLQFSLFFYCYDRISTYETYFMMIALYHPAKTPISFWCKWGLNPKSLIWWQEILTIELTRTLMKHKFIELPISRWRSTSWDCPHQMNHNSNFIKWYSYKWLVGARNVTRPSLTKSNCDVGQNIGFNSFFSFFLFFVISEF